ncbi:MAG: hypothetical protein IPK85_12850 [Gemmatimonadetes bacterium]|nr:hypothetical protein [Gemmatimonadota bacterium]
MLRLSRWAVLVIAAIPLTHAEAQGLGRLVKKAKDKAADAAKALDPKKVSADSTRAVPSDSVGGVVKPGGAAPGTASGSASAAVTASPSPRPAGPAKPAHTPLVLTDETYALFLPVLQADAQRRRALLDYRKGITAYNACKRKAMTEPSRSPSNKAALAAAEARRDSVQERWSVELNKKPGERDLAKVDLLRDSVDYAQEIVFQHTMPAVLMCGTRPFRQPGFMSDGTPNGDSFRVPKPDPVLPAGMSWKQYGLLRERVGIWVVSQGKAGAPLLDAAEVALLKAHETELMPYADYFSMKAMEYLNWGDVANWR